MLLLKRAQLLIPAPLHRRLYRIAHALRLRLWRRRGRTLQGVRAIAIDDAGRVLMIRQSYGSGKWMLPGGAVDRGEDAVAAAMRELAEETGCILDHARLVAEVDETMMRRTNHIRIVVGMARGTPAPDRREVVDARFFAPHDLPEDTLASVANGLEAWLAAYYGA